MPALFNTIGIIGRVKTPSVKDTLITLIDYLINLNHNILIEKETADSIDNITLATVTR